MAYSAWSVVFGEQPSAAKWNILGTNDASFNDGTGIFGLYKNLLATDSNPYKFSANLTSATNTNAGSDKIIPFNNELFDTNNNFDSSTNKGRYTVPVSGFYQIEGALSVIGAPGNFCLVVLYKNGSALQRGGFMYGMAGSCIAVFSKLVQFTAGDYIELASFTSNAVAMGVSAPEICYFTGFLVSRT